MQKLDEVQRRLLINQYRILSLLVAEDSSSYERLITALEWGYSDEYSDEFRFPADTTVESDREFVKLVLKMFLDFAEAAEDGIVSSSDAGRLPKYQGFDGNTEAGLGCYAEFVLSKEGHYRALKPTEDNSHLPMRATYEKFLRAWSSVHNTPDVRPQHISSFLQSISKDQPIHED